MKMITHRFSRLCCKDMCHRLSSKIFSGSTVLEMKSLSLSTLINTDFRVNRFNSIIILFNKVKKQHLHTTAVHQNDISEDVNQSDKEFDSILKDATHDQFTRMIYQIPGAGQRICLIQPILKGVFGVKPPSPIAIQYKIGEAIALIETLHNWKVVDQVILPTKNIDQKQVFGSGNAAKLRDKISPNMQVSAAFVNVDVLTGLQHTELEKLFGMPVFDRYSVVLQIFKDHAKTRVARLQVALAEIPHLRSRLKGLIVGGHEKPRGDARNIGGSGETFLELKRRLLLEREAKLKNALAQVQMHRRLLRKGRRKADTPIVAVVGYTNSGKTSLIKALTGDQALQPVDKLFATLDVTAHGGYLPNRMSVIYMDTVGFISDIPTTLIDAFQATLEDAAQADLIVHIRDISHPNTNSQRECVLETLKQLHLPKELSENIIEVGNKIDLISKVEDDRDFQNCILASATKGTGLIELQELVGERLMKTTFRDKRVFRVPNGGDEARWLYKEAAVNSVIPDEDGQYLLMEVIIGQAALSKFTHYFGDMELNDHDNK